jgi:hypothetical protein
VEKKEVGSIGRWRSRKWRALVGGEEGSGEHWWRTKEKGSIIVCNELMLIINRWIQMITGGEEHDSEVKSVLNHLIPFESSTQQQQ